MFALITLAIWSLGCIFSPVTAITLPFTTTNLLDGAITMQSPEFIDKGIKQLVERQANAWKNGDSDKIIADFVEDCLFIVPGSTFKGKRQIKESAESYFAEFAETQITIKRIIANGTEGAIEWNWSDKNKKTGEITQAEDAIIFELEGGKIKYWREYIDD